MARVFVSYRRADGQYGVGWLAERLRSLDTITGVQTTFHDSALRGGVDFHDELEAEIEAADLVLAVIGPEWLGRRADGEPRIGDPDDWIVRELATARRHGKHIIPIRIGAVQHPLASEVHESIGWIARLNGRAFDDARDLASIVDDVAQRLEQIDLERGRRDGLADPIDVPKLPRPALIAVGAGAAGIAGAVVNGFVTSYANCRAGASCDFQESTGYRWLEVIMPVTGAYVGVVVVIGSVLAFRLHRVASHRWAPMIGVALFVTTTMLLLAISARSGHYAIVDVPSLPNARLRFAINTIVVASAAVVAIGVISPFFSVPRARPHELADRVRALGIARDAERWGALLVSIEFSLVAAAGAAVLAAFDQSGPTERGGPLPNITFALVFSAVLLMAHMGAVARLDDRQAELERDLDQVPPRHRKNATPQLMARGFDTGGWAFRVILALPLIVTVGGAGVQWMV